jgi:cohesin loading factor subunit SCC2
VSFQEDPQTASSRHFYISQWYRDADAEIKKSSKSKKPKKKKEKKEKLRRRGRRGRENSESESSDEDDEEEEEEDGEEEKPSTATMSAEVYRLTEARKEYLLAKINPFGPTNKKNTTLASHIDSTAACLIVKYLSSKRPFFNSFDVYLKSILNVLTEQSIQVRSKALKCMALVVQEDPSVLSRDDMQRGVNYSFLDAATMVREAAVDLVGKFILHRAELIDKYYEMLLLRILDTGVSVRKRVIKILKDICLGFPDYPRIPEICVKMIRRINDEEGIRKLVMDVFQNMWFQPMSDRRRTEKEEHLLVTKANNITDVVVACHDTGLEWFEQLLQTLFKPKEDKDDATKVNREPPKHVVLACQQIVDCLMETVLKAEETTIRSMDTTAGSSHRIVACLNTTFLFAKSRPQLLVNHVQTLQPYLNVRCQTKGDYQIISNVARTLELTVPLIEHPSEIFLSQLEEASMKLILLHDKTVVSACLSCLGSVVNNVTKNFTLIRDCFKKYFGHLVSYKKVHEKDVEDARLAKATPFFRRSLFTVGLLLRHFDFGLEELYAGLEWGSETKMAVFEAIYYFMDHESDAIQNATLQALGSICIRHYDFMMDERLKQRYISILTGSTTGAGSTIAKMQVGPWHCPSCASYKGRKYDFRNAQI